MPTEVSLADITKAVRKNRPPGDNDLPEEENLSLESVVEIDEVATETKIEKKIAFKEGKGKVDKIEEENLEYVYEMLVDIKAMLKEKGKSLKDTASKNPQLWVATLKEFNGVSKRLLDITLMKLKLEELRLQKEQDRGGNTDGSKNVFIIQGLYDSSKPKTIEIQAGEDEPVTFTTKGLDN